MSTSPPLRTVQVTRYITPLREGGSLPALVEADDGNLYVLKFRGAGQGTKALVAELIAGEIARTLGLRMPEPVLAILDPILARTEPDEEIQDLLRASGGLNFALDFLPGASTFDPLVDYVDPKLASQIVWFDCLITNVDRTARNTNLLVWLGKLYLIDHGASLYFHHSWEEWEEKSRRPFLQVKDHVLLHQASELDTVDAEFRALLTPNRLASIVALVPDDWLTGSSGPASPDERRAVYVDFLTARLAVSPVFVQEAKNARHALV
ncbi:MAG: aminotransferase class I and II [Sphingobacteriaceae bacterium]|nr:aminotransferase class I and II [Cytophagaceae bacterium]